MKRLEIFPGDGQGNFSNATQIFFNTDSTAHAMATGDIDRDGNPDYVVGTLGYDSIIIALNTLPDRPVLENTMTTTGYSNVTLDITNPAGFRISKDYRTVAGSEYRRFDFNADGALDDRTVDYSLENGQYKIVFKRKPTAPPDAKFSAAVRIGNNLLTFMKDYQAPPIVAKANGIMTSDSLVFYYEVEPASSIEPPNGASISENRPIFDWSRRVDPSYSGTYGFQIDRYYDFRAPMIDVRGLTAPSFGMRLALGSDSVYYWRYCTDGATQPEFSHPFAVYISGEPTDIGDSQGPENLPGTFTLGQNYPNPFNPVTSFEYALPHRAFVTLTIYNILGQNVRTLVKKEKEAGRFTLSWDGKNDSGEQVSSGIYFYRLSADGFSAVKKMTLLK